MMVFSFYHTAENQVESERVDTQAAVTDAITVDAACPSIEEEVQEAASALDLCARKDDFDTDSDSAIESGEDDSDIDV